MPPPRRPRAVSLDALLPDVVAPVMRSHGFARTEIVARWRDIVGEEIAARCRPERIRRGRDGVILVLRVAPASLLDMSYATDLIRERLDATLGRGTVSRIQLEAGDIADDKVTAVAKAPRRAAAPEALAARLAAIDDPGLRRALAALGGFRLPDA